MGGSQSRYIDSPALHKMKFSIVRKNKCAYNAGSAKWDCVVTTRTPRTIIKESSRIHVVPNPLK